MTEKYELAETLWRCTQKKSLEYALIAAAFCFKIKTKVMNMKILEDEDRVAEAEKYRKKFELHAIRILEIINSKRPDIIPVVILKSNIRCGMMTLLAISFNSESTKFISNTIVQNVLDKIWHGRILKSYSTAKHYRYATSIICPLLAPKMLEFGGKYTYVEKIKCFYYAPKTVYTYNVICHILYNILFAIFLVANTCKAPSIIEATLIVWTCCLAVEEIRQIKEYQCGLFSKIQFWFSDIWNKFDCFALLVFFLAVIYRITILFTEKELGGMKCLFSDSEGCCPLQVSRDLQIMQTIYSASYMLFTFRIFSFYISQLVTILISSF